MRAFPISAVLLLLTLPLSAAPPAHEHGTHEHAEASETGALPHNIPRFDRADLRTLESARSGDWNDPKTWTGGRVPGPDDVVAVRTGMTVTPRGEAVCKVLSVERGATLDVLSSEDLTIRCETLIVHAGGTLRIGADSAPVAPDRTVRVVFRDTPIDTQGDPEQFSHGLIAMGRVVVRGAPKTPFLRLAREPKAGDLALHLARAPEGWRVGDRLALPDTRDEPMDWKWWSEKPVFQWEEPTVAGVIGSTVYLSAPLRYPHAGARDSRGVLRFLPHVVNRTRNVEFRSQNPAGVRGHGLFTGDAFPDLRWCAFVEMGRTTVAPLNETRLNPDGSVIRVGTNQIGRYPLHRHHNHAALDKDKRSGTIIGCVVDGSPRWGVVVHGTDATLVKDTVAYNCAGSCFVTEDGSESFNEFDGCFALRSRGADAEPAGRVDKNALDLGHEGAGFWFRGGDGTVRNCVAANCASAGFITMSYRPNVLPVPRFAGARRSVPEESPTRSIESRGLGVFADNECYGVTLVGLQLMQLGVGRGGAPSGTAEGFRVWHVANGWRAFLSAHVLMRGGVFIGDGAKRTGIGYGGGATAAAGPSALFAENCEFDNLAVGLFLDTANAGGVIRNCRFVGDLGADVMGLNTPAATSVVFENCRFDAPSGKPLRAVRLRQGERWREADLTRPSLVFLRACTLGGTLLPTSRLYYPQQAPDVVMPASQPAGDAAAGGNGLKLPTVGSPEPGLTNAQLWKKHGVATGGAVAPMSTYPGISGFVAPVSESKAAN